MPGRNSCSSWLYSRLARSGYNCGTKVPTLRAEHGNGVDQAKAISGSVVDARAGRRWQRAKGRQMQCGLQGGDRYDPQPRGTSGGNRVIDLSGRVRASLSDPTRRSRGQSLVEFALIVPILLTLFVAIADFGRIFQAGIAIEAATRDAAEAAANQYLANPPGDLSLSAPNPNQAYYDGLHTSAANVVCAELRGLPNTNYDSSSNTCPDMPVCVHDGADNGCAAEASPGTGGIPSGCTDLTTNPPDPSHGPSNADGTAPRWVEIRTCYHFTAILDMPLFSLGDFWLQRTRTFTIPCYFALGTNECG